MPAIMLAASRPKRPKLKLQKSRNGRVDDLAKKTAVKMKNGMRNKRIVQQNPNVFVPSANR